MIGPRKALAKEKGMKKDLHTGSLAHSRTDPSEALPFDDFCGIALRCPWAPSNLPLPQCVSRGGLHSHNDRLWNALGAMGTIGKLADRRFPEKTE